METSSGSPPGVERGYELLDLDRGRKLERFGGATIVRPAPAARGPRILTGDSWGGADAEFVRPAGGPGEWKIRTPMPEPWTVRSAGAWYALELAASGQVGLFPEQEPLREQIARLVRDARRPDHAPRVLDLFGYTGGSTIAAAAAGGVVTFVDGSKGNVARARRNFEANGLAEAGIRSIAEDVTRFATREVKRGSRYDAIILDPPSFGRGPKGQVWKIERDLGPLLELCRALLVKKPAFVLLSSHTESWTARQLAGRLRGAVRGIGGTTESGELVLHSATEQELPAGQFALQRFA